MKQFDILLTMRVLFFATLFIFISLLGHSQERKPIQKVRNERGKSYLIENDKLFEIDRKVITVKLIAPNNTLKKMYRVINVDRCGYIDLQVPENVDVVKFVEELNQTGLFESVEYNGYIKSCISINDSYWNYQQNSFNAINCMDAWNITTGNPSIKVAVIDSGIDISHPDLGLGSDGYGNVSTTLGKSYAGDSLSHLNPTDNHGTAVAGVIAAKTNNHIGIAGVAGGNNAQGATLISYYVTSSYHVRDAIYEAIDAGAKVINISQEMNQMSSLDVAISYAHSHGVSIVCASGNSGSNYLAYPASHAETIAVGSCYNNGTRSTDSQYGTGIDLVAPGINVYTTSLDSGYNYFSGTSFAAPRVSGTIALILSLNPSLSADDIKTLLRNSCTKVSNYNYDSSGWNEEIGYGLLNVKNAVATVGLKITGPSLACTDTPYSVANLPEGMHVVWTLENTSAGCIFHTDTPNVNQCTITSLGVPFYGTLKASIYNGTNLFAVTSKYVYTLWGTGTYKQESCWYYDVQHPAITPKPLKTGEAMFVHQGCWVTLESPYLQGATVTHSGAIPEIWFFDPTNKKLIFSFPLYSGGIPMMIDVHGENSCGDIRYIFFSVTDNGNISSSSLVVEPVANGYLLSVTRNNKSNELAATSISSQNDWNLEIYNATWGNKKLGCRVTGNDYSLDTTGWDSGLYVIRCVIDGEVYTEKITVK